MKCQRCSKQATLHITEVLDYAQFEEHHLCDECAKKYLYEPVTAPQPGMKPSGATSMAEAELPAEIGSKQCEACGIKFVEFRNSGRLGCAHDYDSFREELIPLLESIHGDVRHQGKVPKRAPRAKQTHVELTQLRKKLQQAVQSEDYETAARLRDEIRRLEEADG